MNQGDILRKGIFDRYSSNLHLLHSSGYLGETELPFDETYICPLCLRPFQASDIFAHKGNHLTLEDVPPKSLGGKPLILTCKECNNAAGQKIDGHLYSRMFELDHRNFTPGSRFHAMFTQDGKVTRGEVIVGLDSVIKVSQSYDHNKRETLNEFVKDISPKTGNPLMNIEFYPKRIDFKRLEVALLKTAYLLCFEKYGYAFILDPIYDHVREQIKHPDADIYPSKAWFIGPFKEGNEGCHFVSNHGLECIMSIFTLKSITKRTFGFILPVKSNPVIEIVAGFHASIALEVEYPAEFHRFDHPEQYLENLNNIKEVLGFIDKLKKQ